MKHIALYLLKLYKIVLSGVIVTLFGGGCRFTPTCSDYAGQAIDEHGLVKGSYFSVKRLFRCHPFSKSGYDPVPSNS